MNSEADELIAWCERERASALRQIALFGAEGVKAFLQMPNGATQDITQGVVDHQTENLAMFERIAAALRAQYARSS